MTKQKILVIVIVIALVVSFGILVYYAATYSRGIPTKPEKIERPVVNVPFIEKDIDLTSGISDKFWDTIPSKEINLIYQVTVLPWPRPRDQIEPVMVKAFHNNRDIYFYISWKDESEERIFKMNQFSDACAIMFPMDEKTQPHSIMMGFLGKANIWQWKASQDKEYWHKELPNTDAYSDFYYPFEETEIFLLSKEDPKSAANDLLAIRVGTVTPKETQNISGRGLWNNGVWHVVLKRTLNVVDPAIDAGFKPGKKLCAFAVWNGAHGDRGGRKVISDWAELDIK